MASSTLIVKVNISKTTRVVSQAAFNVVCIFGPSARVTTPTVYNDSASMLASEGGPFMDSDPEYIEAVALMSQAVKPSQFVVAPNTSAVVQEDTFGVGTLTPGASYGFTINSVPVTYVAQNADTQQAVLAALLAAIGTAFPDGSPVTGAITGSGGSAVLTLNSVTAGLGVSYSAITADLVHAAVIVNHSITDDIATAQQIVPQAASFYGVVVCSHVASDILQVAKYVETQLLVYVTATADADCLTNSTTDIMSVLKGLTLDRTLILYSAEANTNGPDGAWAGYMLSTQPGTGNWAMKVLVGVTADNLNPTQIANVLSKNGNIYVIVAGTGTTLYGTTPAGEYIDVTIFIDWLGSTISSGVIAVQTDPLNLKIPYTNQGITQIENPIRGALQQGQDYDGIVPGWDVFAPNASDVPAADKASRTLNNIGFDCELSGAINKINIQGYASN
jgi:hypothetical protein